MAKGKRPSAQDAQTIIQLYDLRREPVMRAARKFMISEFWPQNYDEFKAVLLGYGTEQNAYLRQVITYWDMACAMVVHGAVNEELFFESTAEPYFLFTKFGSYLAQARRDSLNIDLGRNVEKVAMRPAGKKRVKELTDRLQALRARQAAAKASR
ncbi:MAG TPA: hypothetical protein VJV96_19725 [Candidatus Angelobacter sp.]|jgi:hypothetical protein|nr:hypothetical protein [Candidatus Angelobacter sp.]